MEYCNFDKSILSKKSTFSSQNNVFQEEYLNHLNELIAEFSSEALCGQQNVSKELLSVFSRITAELQSVRSDYKQHCDYNYLRAEMWKTAAIENISADLLVERLFGNIVVHLDLKSAYLYKIFEQSKIEKLAQFNVIDLNAHLNDSIPYELINILMTHQKTEPVFYSITQQKDRNVVAFFKRFNIDSISAFFTQAGLSKYLFLFPGFSQDRIWKKWEIQCFQEMINVLSFKLNQQDYIHISEKKISQSISTLKERFKNESARIRDLDSIGLLASGIANDFNEILAQITTNLFVAKLGVMETDEVYKRITDAEKAVFKATCLTKKLTFFSENTDLVKETISIRNLLEDSVGFILKDSSTDYTLDLPDVLWNVDVDKGRMEQVIKILVDNAAQSMADKGVIRIIAENYTVDSGDNSIRLFDLPLVDGDYVKISFKDQGCGIAEQTKEKIFVPYFTTKQNGSGLNLTSAYAIIRQHGGHICFESVQGKGAIFIIYLPASTVNNTKSANKFSSPENNGNNVLLIGNDPFFRIILKKLLTQSAFKVSVVPSVEKAVKLYKEKSQFEDLFSLVIIDISISDIFSIQQAINNIRSVVTEVKVIAFHSQPDTHNMLQCKEIGFDGIIGKTFTINELSQVLKSVLSEGSTIEA